MYVQLSLFIALLFCTTAPTLLPAETIQVVAAENFYGNVAKQIGGDSISVMSIMSNPNQDPHLFSVSANVARSLAEANIIIYNGIDYDHWIINLIEARKTENRVLIDVASLTGKHEGDNPHIWYDPNTMLNFAKIFTEKLSILNPDQQSYYQEQYNNFKKKYEEILMTRIAKIKKEYAGTSVIATEPVFNYMAEALGLKMYGINFQLAVMNDTEPNAKDIIDFEDKITHNKVSILIYNNQVINPIVERMRKLADQSKVAVVGVCETMPSATDYIEWMDSQLQELEKALYKEKKNDS